jgi:hypothetical protein
MACKGECSKQETKVRNVKVGTITPDPANVKECPKRPPQETIDQEAQALAKELTEVVDLVACPKGCGCSGTWGPWGEWLPGNASRTIPIGNKCKYTVAFTYEISGRKYSGVCVGTGR